MEPADDEHKRVVRDLTRGGFLAADDEADALLEAVHQASHRLKSYSLGV